MPASCPVAIDEEIFASPLTRIGRFRRSAAHPEFRDSGPIQNNCFVFPRTAVAISHSGSRIVTDCNTVPFYNRGQEYERHAVSPEGDRCDWYAVAEGPLREAVREWDPRAGDDPRRPLRMTHAHVASATYLAQRQLFVDVGRGDRDQLEVDERVLGLLDEVLAAAYAHRSPDGRRSPDADIVARAKSVLASRLGTPLTLPAVASAVGTSMFHLCRVFRRYTGRTLHGYRTQLRVRAALERLQGGDTDLTQLALAFGFSSHSHFTATFRRAFGLTPSAARTLLRGAASAPADAI